MRSASLSMFAAADFSRWQTREFRPGMIRVAFVLCELGSEDENRQEGSSGTEKQGGESWEERKRRRGMLDWIIGEMSVVEGISWFASDDSVLGSGRQSIREIGFTDNWMFKLSPGAEDNSDGRWLANMRLMNDELEMNTRTSETRTRKSENSHLKSLQSPICNLRLLSSLATSGQL